MAQEFKKTPITSELPQFSMVRGVHHPLVALTRTARHLRINPEATYKSVNTADFAFSVVSNLSRLRLDASAPVSLRFAKMLEAMK
ncbi:hypothetical protein JXA56_01730 [Candidatus Micrarchaeota archaeon]|nr:hypothetical protein [Candidatus Micrarchaeota archaeon]